MVKLGYALSSEEHDPAELVNLAQIAEKSGFEFSLISDHYHPWIDQQGESPFVWSTLGAISQVTSTLELGTGVTCPIMRIHPAIIAQAAATTAYLLEGHFFLGLGTGEYLNEHVIGEHWPSIEIRQDMLIEAVDIIRQLWQGGLETYYGNYFTVERARIYSLPEKLPPIMIAASGKTSAQIAGKIGDGLISTAPAKDIVKEFEKSGGKGKPKYGQITVCYDKDEKKAIQTAFEWWPTAALEGELSQELKIPAYFQQAAKPLTPEQVAKTIICSKDPQKHLQAIKQFTDAGFDHIYVHQVGPNQADFFNFYQKNILNKI